MRSWFVLVILGGVLAGWWYWSKHKTLSEPLHSPVVLPEKNHEFFENIRPGCPSEVRTLRMDDPYLRGVLEAGSTYQASMNYYECHRPQKGDLVLYRYSWKFMPVARQIVAVGGDRLALRRDKQGWQIWINGKVHRSSDNKPFIFGVPNVPPPLQNYSKAHGGVVLENHVVILSSFPPGDKDSTVYGAVEIRDILAKINP